VSDTIETEFHYAVDDKRYRGLFLRAPGGQAKAAVVLLPDWRGQSALARESRGSPARVGLRGLDR
jgi:hypothetical protein